MSALPGLREDAARASADPEAAWSVRVAPLAARALLAGAPAPEPGTTAPACILAQVLRARYGRFPGSFVRPGAPVFGRRFARAVTDPSALAEFAAPAIAGALRALPRDQRGPSLALVPPEARASTTVAFERLRGAASSPIDTTTATGMFRALATHSRAGARVALCAGLAVAVGAAWPDELLVLSHHADALAPLVLRPVAIDEAVARWWIAEAGSNGEAS